MTLREILTEMETIFQTHKIVSGDLDGQERYLLFVTYRRKVLEAFLACAEDMGPNMADVEAESTAGAMRHIADLVRLRTP